jgi:hypothetical protein
MTRSRGEIDPVESTSSVSSLAIEPSVGKVRSVIRDDYTAEINS